MIDYTESNSASVKQGGFGVSLLGLRLLQNGIMENVSASRPQSIPGEQGTPPRSSARSLLKHAGKWAGNDLEEGIKKVYEARGEIEVQDLDKKIERLKALDAISGILNDLTPAQIEIFEQAFKRRPFFR